MSIRQISFLTVMLMGSFSNIVSGGEHFSAGYYPQRYKGIEDNDKAVGKAISYILKNSGKRQVDWSETDKKNYSKAKEELFVSLSQTGKATYTVLEANYERSIDEGKPDLGELIGRFLGFVGDKIYFN